MGDALRSSVSGFLLLPLRVADVSAGTGLPVAE